MTVLVTGGAGFIGSHVCETLLRQGDNVVCLDNFDDFYDRAYKERNLQELQSAGGSLRIVDADITDNHRLLDVFRANEPSAVVHLAALAGVRRSVEQPLRYSRVNVEGTLNVLEACRASGCRTLAFASSSSVYGSAATPPFVETMAADRPSSPYAATKRAGELLCATYSELYGIRTPCLRFFSVYGPRGRPDMAVWKFTQGVLQPPVPLNGDGSVQRDFTYVGDVVDGVLAALRVAPQYDVFNLGRGEPTSLLELLRIVEEVIGRKARIELHPAKQEDVPVTHADLTKARRVLGYEPQVGLHEGVRRFVAWYKEHVYKSP